MKRRIGCWLLGLLALVAAIAATFFLSDMLEIRRQEQAYRAGMAFAEAGDYLNAVTKLQEAGATADAPEQLKKCTYLAGESCLENGEYETAIGFFLESGDYSENVTEALDACYYGCGHICFENGDLEQANAYFDRMVSDQENYGWQHFDQLDDAFPYVLECGLKAQSEINFYIGDMATVSISNNAKLINMAQSVSGDVEFNALDDSVRMRISVYPGIRIMAAIRSDCFDDLTEREMQTYELAKQVVEQAKAETDNLLSLETWLNDWICTHTVYDDDWEAYDTVNGIPENCTAVGVFLNGTALCQGYTDAFYLLGSMAGFEVLYQVGFGRGDGWGGHIWNLICFDGKWYNVDSTWNDTGDGMPPIHVYQNFPAFQDHALANLVVVRPVADTIEPEYDYFAAHDCSYESAEEAAKGIAEKRASTGQKEFEIRINDIETDPDEFFDQILKYMRKNNIYGSVKMWDFGNEEVTAFLVRYS